MGESDSDLSERVRTIALAFRERIGSRFFVHPRELESLCASAYAERPAWRQCLIASVSNDLRAGLSIYATRAPVLSGDFPWASIPVGPGRDSLYPYRPHRFAFLARLALAVVHGIATADQVLAIVNGWITEAEKGRNPYSYGTNLVVIQRILAVSWAWAFLAARRPERTATGLGLEGALLRILWADSKFLESRLGESVPNNHLLADRFADFFLQTVLPEFLQRLDDSAEIRFEEELLRQTYQDGGGFEHSAHYHEFACEMGCAYLLLCRVEGRTPRRSISDRVRALLFFQTRLTGPHATPLPFGNAVEDALFPLDDGAGWCPGSLRELYRSLFDATVTPSPERDVSVERAFWLLGGKLARSDDAGRAESEPVVFSDCGFCLYPDDETGGCLTFRTGPKEGMLVSSGHMHADLLSVYLTVDGYPVLVDSGTYTYRYGSGHWPPGVPEWRSYLAGPAAHNTLTIDGHDPLGTLRGDFRRFDATARVRPVHAVGSGLALGEGRLLDAGEYTGYERGCIHVAGHYWVIYDRPPSATSPGAKRWYGFQCSPGSRVSTGGTTTRVQAPKRCPDLALISSLAETPQVLEGSIGPVGGWVAPRYGEILPAPQLRYALPAEMGQSVFVLAISSDCAPVSARVEALSGGGSGICLPTRTGKDVLILAGESNSGHSSVFEGLVFQGRLLWVRFEGGRLSRVRWLDGCSLAWPTQDLHVEFIQPAGDVVMDGVTGKASHEAMRVVSGEGRKR